jgi:hypothetical protein
MMRPRATSRASEASLTSEISKLGEIPAIFPSGRCSAVEASFNLAKLAGTGSNDTRRDGPNSRAMRANGPQLGPDIRKDGASDLRASGRRASDLRSH